MERTTLRAWLLPTLLLIGLAGCTAPVPAPVTAKPQPQAPHITLNGDDDTVAATSLLSFLNDNGYVVEVVDEDTLLLHFNQGNYLLQPRLTVESIDRLVVTMAYGIVEEYRGSIESLALVTTMNRRFNIGQFSLSDSGDTLYVQSYYTFDNELDNRQLRKFLQWMDQGIGMMVVAMPEIGDFIE